MKVGCTCKGVFVTRTSFRDGMVMFPHFVFVSVIFSLVKVPERPPFGKELLISDFWI